MSDSPREPSDEAKTEGEHEATTEGKNEDATEDDHDHEAATVLAAAALGDTVTAERLSTRLVSERPARLLDVLAPGEQPQYLLEGLMADRVRDDGERSRRMAAPDGSVFTLVTDRAVHVVVQYRERLAVETVPLTSVEKTTVMQAGGDTRFGIDTGDELVEVYPSSTPATETKAAAAYLDEWDDSGGVDAEGDPVSALERLAGLYERGLLTDEEFAAAKRDLLQ